MVSCLAVLHHTHARLGPMGEFGRTQCGLVIPSRHQERDLFAVDPDMASCEDCQRALEARSAPATSDAGAFDAKALVAHFLEQVVNRNDATGWVDALGDNLSESHSPERLGRLHELFPTWQATVDELIAEGDRVVARYRVAYTDPFTLLGAGAPVLKTDQVVIVRLHGRHIVEFRAIVDDFGIWKEAGLWRSEETRQAAYGIALCGSQCSDRLHSPSQELP
jgi:predicted ester cyclase